MIVPLSSSFLTFILNMEPFDPILFPPHLSVITYHWPHKSCNVQYADFIFESPHNALHIDLPFESISYPSPYTSNTLSSTNHQWTKNELARQLEHDFEILNVLGFNITPNSTPIDWALMMLHMKTDAPSLLRRTIRGSLDQCPLHQYSRPGLAAWTSFIMVVRDQSPSP